jgi:hypothetical protein
MKMNFLVASLFMGSAIAACAPGLSVEERPCPCSAGYTCCASTNTCAASASQCAAPAALDASTDLPKPDGGVEAGRPTTLARLVGQKGLTVLGVTDDGMAVFRDEAKGLYAVSTTTPGATPITIATAGSSFPLIRGNWVAVVTDLDLSRTYGTLFVWSQVTGKLSAPGLFEPISGRALDQDARVLYAIRRTTAFTADIAAIDLPAAPQVAPLVARALPVSFSPPGPTVRCRPRVTAIPAGVVTSGCRDEASAIRNVSFFPRSGSGVVLGERVNEYSARGSHVVYQESEMVAGQGGRLVAVDATGSNSRTVDSGVVSLKHSDDGSAVVYQTADGAIRRASTEAGAPPPVALTAPGMVGEIVEVARSFDWAMVAGPDASAPPAVSRISLTIPTAPGTLTFHPGYTGFPWDKETYADGFTANASHALFFANTTDLTESDLFVWPAGGAPTKLGGRVRAAFAATGSTVQVEQSNEANPKAIDLSIANLAGDGALVRLATGIRSWAPTADSQTMIYTSDDAANPGLFVTSVP